MGGHSAWLRGPCNGVLQPERGGVLKDSLVWLDEEEGSGDIQLDNRVPSRINKVRYQSLLIQTLLCYCVTPGTPGTVPLRGIRGPSLVC